MSIGPRLEVFWLWEGWQSFGRRFWFVDVHDEEILVSLGPVYAEWERL